jgi:ActR/RegA family two-component response regulator
MSGNKKILFVDDEKNILNAYKRNLRNQFQIYLADNPATALEIIKRYGPFACVISDLKMPEMDGLTLLEKIKELAPDTVRILLTGYADLNTAIEAINKGNLFRLLTKPCSMKDMEIAINDAIAQYNLIVSERELLTKTLKGSLNVLIEILSTVQPLVFNFTMRFKSLAKSIAERLKYPNMWEVEISALLMHIGLVSVPADIIEKKLHGLELNSEEEKIFRNHAELGAKLISQIPRLEKIAQNIKLQYEPYFVLKEKFKESPDRFPFVAAVLKTLNDYFELLAKGTPESEAIKKMENNLETYDPAVLGALEAEILGVEKDRTIKLIKLAELQPGMILAKDLRDANNFLLLPKGTKINPIMLSKIANYAKMTKIYEPVEIFENPGDDVFFKKKN